MCVYVQSKSHTQKRSLVLHVPPNCPNAFAKLLPTHSFGTRTKGVKIIRSKAIVCYSVLCNMKINIFY
jgi:hypothetical protein